MDLYRDYIKERENLSLLKHPHGWISYRVNENECYLADMFIAKDHRGSGLVKKMIEDLKDIAILSGCELISANIHLNDKGANHTLKAALKLDFSIVRAEHNIIVIVKKLGGE
jgi:predicted GNAT superfamily acetyltransferase